MVHYCKNKVCIITPLLYNSLPLFFVFLICSLHNIKVDPNPNDKLTKLASSLLKLQTKSTSKHKFWSMNHFSFSHPFRDYVRGGGAEGALAPLEFGGSVKRTERETDNLLSLAPPESKS